MSNLDETAGRIANELLRLSPTYIDVSDIMPLLEEACPLTPTGPTNEYCELETLVGYFLKREGFKETIGGSGYIGVSTQRCIELGFHRNLQPI